MTRSAAEVKRALDLATEGRNNCEISRLLDVHRLRIFLDRKYPVIVQEALAAIALINPGDTASTYSHTDCKMKEVSGWSKHWPHLFPQHGPGMKHLRPIRLEPWQQRIVEAHPGRLLRGLIHSDGCRVQNVIRHPKKVYSYPRYFFSNRSGDIQGIFTDACDLLGVRWRQDGPQNISVARRDSVAVLDLHVGPKR